MDKGAPALAANFATIFAQRLPQLPFLFRSRLRQRGQNGLKQLVSCANHFASALQNLQPPAGSDPGVLSLNDPIADRIPDQIRRRTAIRPRKDILSVCFHGLHC